MDFARVEAEFKRLKAQFERGALTEAEFKAQLEELMIEDEQGRWWILGYETGQWYVHDGEQWVQQEPPRAAPGPAAAHPPPPGATELMPDAQPRPAEAVRSRPVLGLKLGRDNVSVLLITAGWLVCFGGGAMFIPGFPINWVPTAVVGGIGGLITGLVLRRTEPPSPWKQVPVVTIGWIIGMAIMGTLFYANPWLVSGAVGGFIGGLITALALKWAHPSLQWKHVALVTLGWGIGWAVGGAIGSGLQTIYYLRYVLWGGIGGAVSGWVTFWQLREARQNAP
jgi:hypothetical protein